MTETPPAIAAELAALAERVRQIQTGGDAIDQRARLELLRSDDAALVGGRRDTSTLARWAAAAEDEGAPLAIKVGTSWLFITAGCSATSSAHLGSTADVRPRRGLEN